jgi:sodium/potassium-transporting ATPase subunit alpha
LALAIVLLIVLFTQAIFNAWQDFSTSCVMASIKGMLLFDVLLLRDSLPPSRSRPKTPFQEISLRLAWVKESLLISGLSKSAPTSDLQFDRSILTGEVKFLVEFAIAWSLFYPRLPTN